MLDVRVRSKDFPSSRGAVRHVLRDVSFTAAAGEIIVLLGQSGIGKSTILRIAMGIERDFDGSVSLRSDRVGFMFQEPRLLPWLSVEDNLRLVQRDAIPVAAITALLDDVMLPSSVLGLLPAALSLGMARRVALARALAVDPEVLILDEPFASLDAGLAAGLGSRIVQRVRRLGTVVLISTHDIDQALSTASRILVVAGEPATLVKDIAVPAHDDTAAVQRLRQQLLMRFPFLASGSG